MIPVSITATREAAERVYGGPASLPAGWTLDTTFGLGGSGQASGPTGGYVYALKTNGVDDHYRVALGNRFEPSPDRTPAETGGNVECPRFSSLIYKKYLNKVTIHIIGYTCIIFSTVFACQALAKTDEEKPIISTGIVVPAGPAYSWCDNNHIAATVVDPVEESERILYFDVSNPKAAIEVEVMNEQGHKLSSSVRACEGNVLLAGASRVVKHVASQPSQRSTSFYTVSPGQEAQLLVTLRTYATRPVSPVHLKEKYLVGSQRKILTKKGYSIEERCATYVRPDFKILCWDTFNRLVWPLSRYVITAYQWLPQVTAFDEHGKPQQVENHEDPVLGTDGHPLVHAVFLLRDFAGKILVNLAEDSIYRIEPIHGMSFATGETHVYAACRKKTAKFDDTPFVCRYPLDGKTHQWEEVFEVTFEGKGKDKSIGSVQDIYLEPNGDIYFFLAGARYPHSGIWKFVATTKQFLHITMPPPYRYDESPKVSPDGSKMAFLRSNGISIVQMRGALQ